MSVVARGNITNLHVKLEPSPATKLLAAAAAPPTVVVRSSTPTFSIAFATRVQRTSERREIYDVAE
jgi:hypothetical protein